jgi:hypothetical protein
MTDDNHPSTWDPALDAVVAAPKHHKVLFENEHIRVLEVTLDRCDQATCDRYGTGRNGAAS